MIEVTIEDVVLRAPKDEEARWLASGKDYKLGFHRVILLKGTFRTAQFRRSGLARSKVILSR